MHKIWLIFLLLLAAPAQAAETITVVADKWCPYNCGEKDKQSGYMIDIIRAAMKKSNIDVVYNILPWKEAIEKTRAGEYDAVVGANHGDAPDFIYPEQLQGISINQVWVKDEATWEYKGLYSLDGLRVGVVGGYSYGQGIDEYLRQREKEGRGKLMVFSSANATEDNIAALLAGKVDVILEDKTVIEYYFASRKQPMLLKAVGNPVSVNNTQDTFIYVAFGPNKKDAERYAKILAEGMQAMQASGELKAILGSYHINGLYRFMGFPADDDDI